MPSNTIVNKGANSDLVEFTEQERRSPVIDWYRTWIPSAEMKALHKRSDFLGYAQTLGFLAILAAAGSTAFYSSHHWPWWATVCLVFLYGTLANFLINAMHELVHGTVFKTKALNRIFAQVVSFLGMINHEKFQASHARHHRYTLHPPDDLEVVLPVHLMVRHFILTGIVNPPLLWQVFRDTVRIAFGKFSGEWELTIYPESDPAKRLPAVRWTRTLLIGHGLVLIVSLYFHQWIIPVLITLPQFYGSWLFLICNNTQHMGLQDNVSDFRLCCRTLTLNPVLQFLYWHMNFHTEHHMYAAVPCYRLGRLHRLIKHDLPPCTHGLVAVWKQIAEIQARQEKDPGYQYNPPLPQGSA